MGLAGLSPQLSVLGGVAGPLAKHSHAWQTQAGSQRSTAIRGSSSVTADVDPRSLSKASSKPCHAPQPTPATYNPPHPSPTDTESDVRAHRSAGPTGPARSTNSTAGGETAREGQGDPEATGQGDSHRLSRRHERGAQSRGGAEMTQWEAPEEKWWGSSSGSERRPGGSGSRAASGAHPRLEGRMDSS